MTTPQFLKDREEALRSLDPVRIATYLRKYGEDKIADQMEKEGAEGPMMAGMHRQRLTLDCFTAEEKKISWQWLHDRGYQPRPLQ